MRTLGKVVLRETVKQMLEGKAVKRFGAAGIARDKRFDHACRIAGSCTCRPRALFNEQYIPTTSREFKRQPAAGKACANDGDT